MGLLEPDPPRRPGAAGSWPRAATPTPALGDRWAAWRPWPPLTGQPPHRIRRTEGCGSTNGWEQAPSHWAATDGRPAAHQAGDRKPRRTAALGFVARSRVEIAALSIGRGGGRPPSRGCSGCSSRWSPKSRMASLVAVLEGGRAGCPPAMQTLAPSRRNAEKRFEGPGGAMSSAPHVEPRFQPKRSATVAVGPRRAGQAPVFSNDRFLPIRVAQQGLAKRVVDLCGAPVWLRSFALQPEARARTRALGSGR